MNLRWKLSAVLAAMSLTMCAPIFGPVGTGGISGSVGGGGDTVFLTFAMNGGLTGTCMRPGGDSSAAGASTACTDAQAQTNTHTLTVQGTPEIAGLSCEIVNSAGFGATLGAGESVTFTPVWMQGDGAGTVNRTDSGTTVTFTDPDDQYGDTKSSFTASTSPYTGAQSMSLRFDITGAITMTHMVCSVVVKI